VQLVLWLVGATSRSIFRCQLPIRRKDSLRPKESAGFFCRIIARGQCLKRKGDEGVQFLLGISLGNNLLPTPPSHDSAEGLDHSGDKFAEDGQAREPAAIDSEENVILALALAQSEKSPRQWGRTRARVVV
jgi:hypothetical protein